MFRFLQNLQDPTVPSNNSNVFEKIARIEDQFSVDDKRHIEDAKHVNLILKFCMLFLLGVALLHVLCNNISYSLHKNESFLVALNVAFKHTSVLQASVFNAGTSSIAFILLWRRSSDDAFTKFLHPLMKWSLYGILPPGWIYCIVYNNSSLSSQQLFQDIWLMSQAVSFFVPLLLLGGLVHILDVDRVVWSRPIFIIYCIALLGVYAFPAITLTGLVLPHLTFLVLNCSFIIGWLATQMIGYISWLRSPKKSDTIKQRNENNLISIILFFLSVIAFGNIAIDFVSVLHYSPPNGVSALQLRIFVLEALSWSIFALIVFILFAKSLIEDQSKELELVVMNHGQVFEKPPSEEQVP